MRCAVNLPILRATPRQYRVPAGVDAPFLIRYGLQARCWATGNRLGGGRSGREPDGQFARR